MLTRSLSTFALASLLCVAAFAAEEEFSSPVIQIGMICSDLDETVEFYTEIVGLTEQEGFSVDAEFGNASGLTDSLPINVRVLKIRAGDDATQLKLMSFGPRAKKQENQFLHTNTGIQYITLRVTELNPIIERIKKNEIEMLGETPIPLGEKNHFVLIKDPDGTFVELIGPLTAVKRFQNIFD